MVRSTVEGVQYSGGTSSVHTRVCSVIEDVQYGPVTPSVHLHYEYNIFTTSTDGQYRGRTASKWMQMCNVDLWCAVQLVTSPGWTRVCSTYKTTETAQRGCCLLYLYGKMIFYRQSHYNLAFMLSWLY